MPLEVRKNSVGGIRPIWYGAYKDSNGKRVVVALKEPLPVELYPGSLKKVGCARWEASRARAQKELDDFAEEARTKGRADRLTEKLIESKTGQVVPEGCVSCLHAL